MTSLTLSQEQALMEAKNDLPVLNVIDRGNLPIEKSRPRRSLIVLLAAVLAGLASWAWYNREFLWACLDLENLNKGPKPTGREGHD